MTDEEKLEIEIKKMESMKREAATSKIVSQKKDNRVNYSSWYYLRSKQIPKVHLKEIILADFEARGLSLKESMETYDEALKKYGIDLD